MQRKFGEKLDWDYVMREAGKTGIADFVQRSRNLADKLFSGEALTDAEAKELDYFITSGVCSRQWIRFGHLIRSFTGTSGSSLCCGSGARSAGCCGKERG